MRTLLIAGVVLLAAGCATKPVAMDKAVPVPASQMLAFATPIENAGRIVAMRDTGFLGGGCDLAFYIDGTLAARVGHGERAEFFVPAGEHIVGTGPTGRGTCRMGAEALRKETSVRLAADETKRFRLSINPNSGPAIEPTAF